VLAGYFEDLAQGGDTHMQKVFNFPRRPPRKNEKSTHFLTEFVDRLRFLAKADKKDQNKWLTLPSQIKALYNDGYAVLENENTAGRQRMASSIVLMLVQTCLTLCEAVMSSMVCNIQGDKNMLLCLFKAIVKTKECDAEPLIHTDKGVLTGAAHAIMDRICEAWQEECKSIGISSNDMPVVQTHLGSKYIYSHLPHLEGSQTFWNDNDALKDNKMFFAKNSLLKALYGSGKSDGNLSIDYRKTTPETVHKLSGEINTMLNNCPPQQPFILKDAHCSALERSIKACFEVDPEAEEWQQFCNCIAQEERQLTSYLFASLVKSLQKSFTAIVENKAVHRMLFTIEVCTESVHENKLTRSLNLWRGSSELMDIRLCGFGAFHQGKKKVWVSLPRHAMPDSGMTPGASVSAKKKRPAGELDLFGGTPEQSTKKKKRLRLRPVAPPSDTQSDSDSDHAHEGEA